MYLIRDMRLKRTRTPLATFLVLLAGLTLVACGDSAGSGGDASTAPDYAKDLAGSPAPLAALHKQRDQLLDGGRDAFDARMASLKGYPVVVNAWASWCGPCLLEFPHFQDVSASLGRKVAFVGVNVEDSEDSASTFLRDHPVPYPSYNDPDRDIYSNLKAIGYPATAFFDRSGNMTYLKQGPYTDSASLEADVRRFAIDGEGG